MSSPILRPAAWVRYTTALHLKSSKTETAASGELPQFYADRFGWQQQVAIVARAFNSLSPADQRRVCIFGGNYGEAGAIDFFNRRDQLHLPPALSAHNNYWLWGMHGCDPDLVIAVIDDSPDDVSKKYESVTSSACATRPTPCLSSTATSTCFAADAPPRPSTGPTSAITTERYPALRPRIQRTFRGDLFARTGLVWTPNLRH